MVHQRGFNIYVIVDLFNPPLWAINVDGRSTYILREWNGMVWAILLSNTDLILIGFALGTVLREWIVLDPFASIELISKYSYRQIRKYTDNFRDKLGQGVFCQVFKGKLPNGSLVAIKLLDNSRQMAITAARGTPGYAAPEMWLKNNGPVTDKSDVYSFGMLLLEMVGERKNMDMGVRRSSQFCFPEWAFKQAEKGEFATLRMRSKVGGINMELLKAQNEILQRS
eukprot:Gb_14764 [translate_table: standard]